MPGGWNRSPILQFRKTGFYFNTQGHKPESPPCADIVQENHFPARPSTRPSTTPLQASGQGPSLQGTFLLVCVQLWALVQPCKGKTRALTLGPRSGLHRDSPKDSTRAPQPSPREGTNPNKAGSTTKVLWRNQVHQVLPEASLSYHMPRARRGGKKNASTQGAGSGFCRGHGAHRAALTYQESGEGGSRTGSVGPTRKP